MIRIGANPIGWSNDDKKELGGHIPLEQCLKEAKAAGFEGMELGNKFPRTAEALKKALKPFDLALVGGWWSLALLERDAKAEFAAARDHIDLLKALGSTVFIAAECSNSIHGNDKAPISSRPVLMKDGWKAFGKCMTEIAKRVHDEGLRLVYHHHMGTVVQSEAEIDRLMHETGDAVHLLLDCGHTTWGGGDPARVARHYKSRIGHVHAKDVREAVMRKVHGLDCSFLDAVVQGVYTVPGDGMVDFVAVFKELKGYSGWVVVEAEQDPDKAPPAKYAKMGYDNLRKMLKAGGLT